MKLIYLLLVHFIFSAPTFAADVSPIRIQIGSEPKTLEPARVSDLSGFAIVSNTIETLMKSDENGRLKTALAKDYQISNNGLTYTFRLRKDAKWSDGKSVSPDDCVRGILAALNPTAPSEDAGLLFSIVGAKDFTLGRKNKGAVGVHVSNGTVEIELEHSDPTFLMALSLPMTAPIRSDFSKNWNFRQPTNGAYFIKDYRSDEKIELEPNPYYHEPAKHAMIYRIVTEPAVAFNMFEAGQLDIISSVNPFDMQRLETQGLLAKFPGVYVMFLSFNTKRPPFDEPKWRKAVASSIDRDGLARVVGKTVKATASYVPTSLGGRKNREAFLDAASVNQVRKIKNKPAIQIGYSPTPIGDLVVQKVQNDLKKNLQVETSIQRSEWKVFLDQLRTNAPAIYYLGMGAEFNDPINQLRQFGSDNPAEGNYSKYQNPKYQNLLQKISHVSVGSERTRLVQKAEKMLVEDDTVVVPLLEKVQVFGISKKIVGFKVNPFSVIQLNRLNKTN